MRLFYLFNLLSIGIAENIMISSSLTLPFIFFSILSFQFLMPSTHARIGETRSAAISGDLNDDQYYEEKVILVDLFPMWMSNHSMIVFRTVFPAQWIWVVVNDGR